MKKRSNFVTILTNNSHPSSSRDYLGRLFLLEVPREIEREHGRIISRDQRITTARSQREHILRDNTINNINAISRGGEIKY